MMVQLTHARVKEMARSLRTQLGRQAPSYAKTLDMIARMHGYAGYAALKPALAACDNQMPWRVYTVLFQDGDSVRTLSPIWAPGVRNAEEEARRRLGDSGDLPLISVLYGATITPPENPSVDDQILWTVILQTEDRYRPRQTLIVPAVGVGAALRRAINSRRHDTGELYRPDKQRTPEQITPIAVLPGHLAPADETQVPFFTKPRLLIEMEGGIIQFMAADQDIMIMRVDRDVLQDFSCAAGEEEAEIEDAIPHWDGPDEIATPLRVHDLAERHQRAFRTQLRDLCGLDAPDATEEEADASA
ncbi:hypothetical protein CKO28_00560 [Rhodovibrio sodomensis]|uniref:Uncharacterized protein n=1 Tax=Rhodovibrio sodomensis TaxID=1088 RepID=A0ABS1D985_9PROT|nr:hypothetical protein [Rhodovibrio sodomensis]MBK1666532.1 hypothetical protein [Rhodovibrio sodomensis]